MTKATSLTVIIPTRNRPDSLRETLSCLVTADRTGIDINIIVVDNNSDNEATKQVFKEFQSYLPIQYLFEPTIGNYGKSHALNRALDKGELGEIIVILDDDMSPEKNWLHGVVAITNRWPDADLFTGRSFVIWPEGNIPIWAKDPRFRGWAYSVYGTGSSDKKLGRGRNFSGNHFWFRSRLLDSGLNFEDIWMTEPDFMFSAAEMGFVGVSGPDAVTGHRIQRQLLNKGVILKRAIMVGRNYAQVRLIPYRKWNKHAYIGKRFPLLYRTYCYLNLFRWNFHKAWAYLVKSNDKKYIEKAVATERIAFFMEALKILSNYSEYQLRFMPKNKHKK